LTEKRDPDKPSKRENKKRKRTHLRWRWKKILLVRDGDHPHHLISEEREIIRRVFG
jgi:hypothetical protein